VGGLESDRIGSATGCPAKHGPPVLERSDRPWQSVLPARPLATQIKEGLFTFGNWRIQTGLLEEQKHTYNEHDGFTFTSFDGTAMMI
jgi:hypothetical protein